jgi:hypothetical protein
MKAVELVVAQKIVVEKSRLHSVTLGRADLLNECNRLRWLAKCCLDASRADACP